MRDLSKAILSLKGPQVSMVPCTVTGTSPLTVTIQGTANIPGVPIAGLTYSLGPALALLTSPGRPVILPIGA